MQRQLNTRVVGKFLEKKMEDIYWFAFDFIKFEMNMNQHVNQYVNLRSFLP